MIKKLLFSLSTISTLFVLAPMPAYASHSWGGYHWARTSNPFTLSLGDDLSSNWDPYLATTSSDWSLSAVLDTQVTSGKANPKTCRPTAGRVEVCNAKYGQNGWLGVAQIWISTSHITKGTVKVNDTYFNAGTYNTPAWKNLVMCQEVGHMLGLDHQDEDFNNPPLGTCMDYTLDPTPNQHPNQHDYDELAIIYSHLDTSTTVGSRLPTKSSPQAEGEDPDVWGKLVKHHDKVAMFERDLGNKNKIATYVIYQ